MQRTCPETAEELYVLNDLLNNVPQYSTFGDDNHQALAAQIKVITEGMTKDQMLEEYEDGEDYTLYAALDAYEWMHEDGDPVSEGWTVMIEDYITAAA